MSTSDDPRALYLISDPKYSYTCTITDLFKKKIKIFNLIKLKAHITCMIICVIQVYNIHDVFNMFNMTNNVN